MQGVLTVRELSMAVYRVFCQGTGHDNIQSVLSGNRELQYTRCYDCRGTEHDSIQSVLTREVDLIIYRVL